MFRLFFDVLSFLVVEGEGASWFCPTHRCHKKNIEIDGPTKIPPQVVSFLTSCPPSLTSFPNLYSHCGARRLHWKRIILHPPPTRAYAVPFRGRVAFMFENWRAHFHSFLIKCWWWNPRILFVPGKFSVSVGFGRGKTHPNMNKRGLGPRGHETYTITQSYRDSFTTRSCKDTHCVVSSGINGSACSSYVRWFVS